ncbi:GPI transamidase component PIG-S [Penicillium digitatum]|uniref:GPI transamidase component PIG-S n=1 Tax=Penicillium digitatum TaxID=36651 RepID=A0A7T7BIY2_PENDI|nr:GPI transamidase component PIG-S [Penicillium digitatum]
MTRPRPSALLLLALMASIRPGQAYQSFDLPSRSSDACSSSCSSGSTCISLDQGSSSICCPAGQDCDYISPITCDIQQQNVTAYPESVIKTTRLGDILPKCGNECCPFGYTCQGNTCALNQKTSTTATASASSSSASTSSPSSVSSSSTSKADPSESSSSINTASSTTKATSSTTPLATITPVASPSSEKSATPTTCTKVSRPCPSFPAGAIAVGFFPGAVFGAIAALLTTFCVRRTRKDECEIQEGKSGPNWSQRSSSGAILCISNPIPQDDTSYRTDFLRSPPRVKRSSTGGRSTRTMIHRTGSRVRSLFSSYPRQTPRLDNDMPPIPMPNPTAPAPAPFTPPRQRQPRTESIKVYSPPESSLLQSRNFLGPEPYPGGADRPDTLFSDLMKVVAVPHVAKVKAPFPTNDDSRENPFRDPVR